MGGMALHAGGGLSVWEGRGGVGQGGKEGRGQWWGCGEAMRGGRQGGRRRGGGLCVGAGRGL